MPTALELGHKGWEPYLQAARERQALRGKHAVPFAASSLTPMAQHERERLLKLARQVAHLLKAKFGAHRVILFGSLAHAAWFTTESDVDLAVEGLSGQNYWQAWRMAEEIIGDRPVELIEIETAGESLRRALSRYGMGL